MTASIALLHPQGAKPLASASPSATPYSPMMPGPVLPWNDVVAIAIVVLLIGLLIGYLVAWRPLQTNDDQGDDAIPAISWVWFLFGIMAVLAHALLVGHRVEDVWEPSFDNVALFWAIFAVVGFLLPVIAEVDLPGGFGLKLKRTELQNNFVASVEAISELTQLLRDWTGALRSFLAQIDAPDMNGSTAGTVLKSFLEQRCYEATQWAASDGEDRRLALWLYDTEARVLRYFFSNEIIDEDSINATFAIGEGLMGITFGEGGELNVSCAWKQPAYKQIRPISSPQYNGLLLITMAYGDRKIGMLSVDRTLAERFPDDQVRVFKSLASVVVTATESDRLKRLVQSATREAAPGK